MGPEKHGTWKTWNKYGIKKICQTLESYVFKRPCAMWFAIKFTDTHNYIFQAKNCSYNNSIVKWNPENIKSGLCFPSFLDYKKRNLHFYSSNIMCQQYWSSEKMCLESKVWMSRFLIRSSRLMASCKKGVVKNFPKLIEQYPWCRGLQLYWKETQVYVISQEFCRTTNVLRTTILQSADRLLLLKYLLKFKEHLFL